MVGDKTDNLAGVPRVGMKTVAKLFPWLSESKRYDTENIITDCQNKDKLSAAEKNIVANEKLIDENYSIMQLHDPTISYTNKQSIDFQIQNFEFDFVKLNIVKMLFADGQGSINFNELYGLLKNISNEQSW